MSDHPATYADLAGQAVFITGGGSGIGAWLTRGFLQQGCNVAFVQRSDASPFCDEMEQLTGRRPLFIRCDITDTEALRAAIAEARGSHGPAKVLVNNAANDSRHEALEITPAAWQKIMAVNLDAVFFGAQAVIDGMRELGGGSIVNFSSISYMMGNAGYPGYVTANAGITGLTRALAREFGPDGIRCNALMPGWVMTERQLDRWVTPEGLKDHLARQCIKTALEPRDIVGGTLFLASDASRMMTGQALVIDGGVVTTG